VAENERDPVIAAALGKLAADDEHAAQDAGAVLEWIAGEQGLSLITQERVQRFLWYELPLKWMSTLDHKLAIAEAFARALDVLDLPRYATICRSATTRVILQAYEQDEDKGLAAFHRADTASGIRPPDLAEFEWGSTMGWEEARALSSTADFLELAVASGDLVPGARGWKTRQQELVRSCLSTPRVELAGQTPAHVILTERIESWINTRRSETRRKLLAGIANRLLHPASLPPDAATDPLPPLRWLLSQLTGGVALTQTGNLNQQFVRSAAERFGWDFSRPPRTEDDLYDLHQLRHLAQRLGLARRRGRKLLLTAKGHGLLTDADGMWRAAARGFLAGDQFSQTTGELFLALLLDVDALGSDEITATVAQAVAEEGYRDTRTGEPPDERAVSWATHDTINLCRALGLLSVGGSWRHRSYGLTEVGKATALEALRARAGGPRMSPWG